MKILFFFSLLILPFSAFTKVSDCYRKNNIENREECMAFERDQAVGKLMTRVASECAADHDVAAEAGGENYQLLLDQCMVKKLDELSDQSLSDK